MGRNNDTFTLVVDRQREAWGKFRRALRKEDQSLFDEMWRAPKIHLAAGAFIANETPIETVLMCMLLEQYKKIKYLEAKHSTALSEPPACVPLCALAST